MNDRRPIVVRYVSRFQKPRNVTNYYKCKCGRWWGKNKSCLCICGRPPRCSRYWTRLD